MYAALAVVHGGISRDSDIFSARYTGARVSVFSVPIDCIPSGKSVKNRRHHSNGDLKHIGHETPLCAAPAVPDDMPLSLIVWIPEPRNDGVGIQGFGGVH